MREKEKYLFSKSSRCLDSDFRGWFNWDWVRKICWLRILWLDGDYLMKTLADFFTYQEVKRSPDATGNLGKGEPEIYSPS
jgi:hypothetical protein